MFLEYYLIFHVRLKAFKAVLALATDSKMTYEEYLKKLEPPRRVMSSYKNFLPSLQPCPANCPCHPKGAAYVITDDLILPNDETHTFHVYHRLVPNCYHKTPVPIGS